MQVWCIPINKQGNLAPGCELGEWAWASSGWLGGSLAAAPQPCRVQRLAPGVQAAGRRGSGRAGPVAGGESTPSTAGPPCESPPQLPGLAPRALPSCCRVDGQVCHQAQGGNGWGQLQPGRAGGDGGAGRQACRRRACPPATPCSAPLGGPRPVHAGAAVPARWPTPRGGLPLCLRAALRCAACPHRGSRPWPGP